MRREKLIRARIKKGLSQEVAGGLIGVSRNTWSLWERGKEDPYPYNVGELCTFFGVEDPAELDLLAGESDPVERQHLHEISGATAAELDLEDAIEISKEVVGKSAAQIPFLEPQTSLKSSIVPEEFLLQCANSLRACWHLLHNKGIAIASELIATYMPTLMSLALSSLKYQETAASLATQAKILQAVLAMHRSDVSAREMHCLEAVRYGQFSDDRGLLAAALMYVGYTYTYCMPKPKKAIIYYEEAIQTLGNEISLLRSDIYIGLADAYAKVKDEQKVLESITFAQNYFPLYPEQDSRFLYADCKWSELYQWEGKAYLDLAQHYSSSNYYKKALEAFTRSAEVQSVGDLSTSETMLNQAEVARGLGDLERYESCLREGTLKGLAAGSQKRYNEAYTIFQQTPKKWLSEKRMHDLAVEVFHK